MGTGQLTTNPGPGARATNQSKRKESGRRAAAVIAASVIAGSHAIVASASNTWTNGSGDGLWQTNTNWQLVGQPGTGDDLLFPTPGPISHTITIASGGVQAYGKSLQFDADYTIGGTNPLNLAGAPITVTGAATAAINAKIVSSTGLTKSGTGTLVLGGDNSTTITSGGDVHINAGTLRISADNNLGAAFKTWTNGTLEVDGTFTSMRRFEPSNGIIRVTAGNTLTLSANDQFGFSNTDTWTKDGPGTMKVTGHSSRFGATTLAGGTTILAGGDIGYGPLIVGNATLELGPYQFGTAYLSNNLTLNNGAVLRAVGPVIVTNPHLGGGDVNVTFATGTSPTDTLTPSLSNTFGGTVGSTINISGAGTVNLSAATNYPGNWSINSGTLRVTNAPLSLGTGNGAIAIGNGGTLQMAGSTLNRAVNLNDGSALRASGLVPTSALLSVAAGASVTLGGSGVGGDTLSIGGGSNKLNGGAGGTINIASGVVILNSATTFAGDWSINSGGTLRLTASATLGSGTSPVTINAGGTLELNSAGNLVTLSRDVNLNNGGTLKGGPVFNNAYGKVNVASGGSVTFSGLLQVGDQPNDLTGGGSGASIHVASSGDLALAQPSDVAANWSIDSGTLDISDDAQLGAAGNTVTINGTGAKLRTSQAAVNSSRDIVANVGTIEVGIEGATFGNVSGAGTLSVAKTGDGVLTINRIRTHGLVVSTGLVKIKADGTTTATSALDVLAVQDTGRFDLANNKMVVRATPVGSWNGTAYTNLTGEIASGRNQGAWDGVGGIITSQTDATSGDLTSVGIARASDALGIADAATATFAGQTVTGTDTLIAYTYGGDANLDGAITGDDYFQIDSGFSGGATGWFNGDFNYDGAITGDDYFIIDSNFPAQGAPLSGGEVAAVSAVPEPASLAVIMMSLAIGGRRRRSAGA